MSSHRSAALWSRRVGWFALIWLAGVLALAVVAELVRLLMALAGLAA